VKPVAHEALPFDVVRPRELGEAHAVLSRFDGNVRVLVGRQGLLPLLNLHLVRPTGRSLTELSRRRSCLR
jgi:CO/xanthine dehydrogenase FAD-binding subunit